MSNHIELSIILVTFNSLPALEQSLISLTKSLNKNFELIVVDNNSTDNSVETVLAYFPHARIIKNNYNAGFAKACNLGVKNANGELCLFYNPDLEIDIDSLDNLIDFMHKTENVGAVSGRMRFPDDSFQATCRNFPDTTNIFLSRGSALSNFFQQKNIIRFLIMKQLPKLMLWQVLLWL